MFSHLQICYMLVWICLCVLVWVCMCNAGVCVSVCVCLCAFVLCCDLTVLLDGKIKQKIQNILEETGRKHFRGNRTKNFLVYCWNKLCSGTYYYYY